jgi:glycine/D-amino acid oxidase-like deaminating enzyme
VQYKIGFFVLFCLSLFGIEHIYLKTPNLSRENILGTNVGIRPYRKSGVRIEAEMLQNKLIVHNYGYGGSGLTLCLGGAKEVVDILNAQNSPSRSVAVLGAGVAGLAVAYDLLVQGYEVHIYSDEWSPNLTSNVAAGIWSPLVLPEDASAEKKEMNQRMLETSEKRFLNSVGDHPQFAGVRFIDSYSFKTATSQEAIKTKHRGEEVVVHFDNGVTKTGRKIQELGIDGKLFVEDLYSKVRAKGAVLIHRHFENLEGILSLQEPTIINCTSIGSRKLFNDQEFMPVRGQIIYFYPEAEIDFLLYQNVPDSTTSWVSIYPWNDRIILGGIYERGEEEAIMVPEVIDMIIENGQKCLSGYLAD